MLRLVALVLIRLIDDPEAFCTETMVSITVVGRRNESVMGAASLAADAEEMTRPPGTLLNEEPPLVDTCVWA